MVEAYPHRLFCAYQVDVFNQASDVLTRASTCQTHAQLILSDQWSRIERWVQRALARVVGEKDAAALKPLADAIQFPIPGVPRPLALLLWIRSRPDLR